jgi:hypothetical protein
VSTVRRAQALIVLAGVREVEGFELELAARTLAAGWGGDIEQLLEATAGVMALRHAADKTSPAAPDGAANRGAATEGAANRGAAEGWYPQLEYLLAVERALAGREVAVLCREVDRVPLELRGRLTLDLARAVGARPLTCRFAVEWSSARGWSTVVDQVPGTTPEERLSRRWFDGLLTGPAAVADRIVRQLDGDLSMPPRRGWRCDGARLLADLEAHRAAEAPADVPTLYRTDPEWRREHFQRLLLRYEPPPTPTVGAEVHLPGLPGDRRRVVEVLPRPPGAEDLFWVRLAGHDFPISWDAVWQHLA